jgi:hypothetical protein
MAVVIAPSVCEAQLPVGAISGSVRDSSGAVLTGAQVHVASRTTGQARSTTTGERGEYSFPTLLPGEYVVSVELSGFQSTVRVAIVEAGSTTTADFTLRVGELRDSVTVPGASPQIRHDSASVSGLVTHDQIEALPLNGRGFLELAKLEPGVQPAGVTNRNRTLVAILGAPAANVGGARFTVDGGSVTAVALGGAQIGLSQEAVQEFQVSSVNFDLAAGMTDAGSVNVVTRSGGNDVKGAAFYFFRDHHLGAYPGLSRDPNNPEPFFQRQQLGAAIGGPLRRNRAFYFASWERNDQRGVAATTLVARDFAHLSRVTSSPLVGNLFTARVDTKINSANSLLARYSYDGSHVFGPSTPGNTTAANAYPSNWTRLTVGADQTVAGLTSVVRPTLVKDLRLSVFRLRSTSAGARTADCPGCLGVGSPSIMVVQTGLLMGNSSSVDNLERRLQLNDAITWQHGTHRVRVGVDWEQNRDRNLIWNNEPVSITLYSPDRVRAFNSLPNVLEAQRIPLPESFRKVEDILELPLQSVTIGIGRPGVSQENGGAVRRWNDTWLYGEDAWQLQERVTLTYGLGWGYNGVLNHDLRKPPLLAPILGADGLGPTRKIWTNFAPAAGVAWTPSANGKTVVHMGAGRFFRTQGLTSSMDSERVALGPAGSVRQNLPGSSILNWLPGVPGLPVGAPLEFRNGPTLFTGAHLIGILPALRAGLARNLANAEGDVQQIQITKQATPAIFPEHVPNPSAVHLNIGLQRQLSRDTVLSVDAVARHFVHVPQNGGAIDVNHYPSARGPVVPKCSVAEATDPQAVCSLGAINVQVAPYRFTYKGLLVRLDRRMSHGVQLLGSYAWSRNSGTNTGNGFNLDDWLANTGPAANDFTHVFNTAGVVRLPRAIVLGFNLSYSSTPPLSVFLGDTDFNGDGTKGDLLPGTTVNAFNRGMGRTDLERLIVQFNDKYAGTRDGPGALIPRVVLPSRYSLGDNFHSLDLRLTRSFAMRSQVRMSLIAEAFNVYNASNLSGHSGDVTRADFGQATSRVTQVFGSGGPRAFQFAARLSF